MVGVVVADKPCIGLGEDIVGFAVIKVSVWEYSVLVKVFEGGVFYESSSKSLIFSFIVYLKNRNFQISARRYQNIGLYLDRSKQSAVRDKNEAQKREFYERHLGYNSRAIIFIINSMETSRSLDGVV